MRAPRCRSVSPYSGKRCELREGHAEFGLSHRTQDGKYLGHWSDDSPGVTTVDEGEA